MLNADSEHELGKGNGSALALDGGLRRLLRCARDGAEALGLHPVPLPDDLARVEGAMYESGDETPLSLCTERYHGERLASLTVAAMETARGMCSLTLIGLPAPGLPFPVLGVDIIALRGTISLCALDLAPMDDALWQERCAPLLCAVQDATRDSLVMRKRPRFADDTFSPLATIAGVRPGREAAVFTAVALLIQHTVALLLEGSGRGHPPEYTPAARERLQRWLLAERQNRKEHNALARMFGAKTATRYLDEFLFAHSQEDC